MFYHKNNILTRTFVVARTYFRHLLRVIPAGNALLFTFFLDIIF